VPVLAVTDTHALIWYATGLHRRLGRAAKRFFDRADSGRAAIYVPTIVLVEIAELTSAGRIELPGSFQAWERALFGSGKYLPASLTREVVRLSAEFAAIPERGDRLIAATAMHLGCQLITRVPEIGTAARVPVVW
jgi:PIN domain nuclease of toxin-antitoxin system